MNEELYGPNELTNTHELSLNDKRALAVILTETAERARKYVEGFILALDEYNKSDFQYKPEVRGDNKNGEAELIERYKVNIQAGKNYWKFGFEFKQNDEEIEEITKATLDLQYGNIKTEDGQDVTNIEVHYTKEDGGRFDVQSTLGDQEGELADKSAIIHYIYDTFHDDFLQSRVNFVSKKAVPIRISELPVLHGIEEVNLELESVRGIKDATKSLGSFAWGAWLHMLDKITKKS